MQTFDELKMLTEMQYQKGQNELHVLVQEESRLRAELERLAMQVRDADSVGINLMNSTGADILWRAWVGRMRTELNTQLALVLSKKERFLARAKRDYSRVLVTRNIATRLAQQKKKDRFKASLEGSIDADLARRLIDNQ